MNSSDSKLTGLEATTMGRLVDGAEAMAASAAARLGVVLMDRETAR